jgi:hypothetical protein
MLMTGIRVIEDLSISVCMGLKTDGMHFPDTKKKTATDLQNAKGDMLKLSTILSKPVKVYKVKDICRIAILILTAEEML